MRNDHVWPTPLPNLDSNLAESSGLEPLMQTEAMDAMVVEILRSLEPSEPETIYDAVKRLATLPTLEYESVRIAEAKRINIRTSELDRAVLAAINSETPAQDGTEGIHETITRLAALQPIEYEKVRSTEAKRLNIRAAELDKAVAKGRPSSESKDRRAGLGQVVEPWPGPVALSDLLCEIRTQVHRFVICNKSTGILVSLWVVFTWLIDHMQVAPILVITAPEKRCGKSTLLDLVSRLACRPIVASNISPSAVFRVIEQMHPTLLIDEADTFLKENEQMRGVLNSGHTRSSAFVWRVEGEDLEVVSFSTWAAKAISVIGHLPPTLMDRSIVATLRRKLRTETCERLRHSNPQVFKDLSSKLARFAEDEGRAFAVSRPDLPEELTDRGQDNWEPLLAIAEHAGGEWLELARSTALEVSIDQSGSQSMATELLGDIKAIFDVKGTDWIHTTDLINALIEDESKPWSRFAGGTPITPRQVGTRLASHGISSRDIRDGHFVKKGYRAVDFKEAFSRYLPTQKPISDDPLPATE